MILVRPRLRSFFISALQRVGGKRALFLSVIIGGIIFVLAVTFLGWRYRTLVEKQRVELSIQAEHMAQSIAARLEGYVDLMQVLASAWASGHENSEKALRESISLIQRHFDAFAIIGLIAPDFRLTWILPEETKIELETFLSHELMLQAYLEDRVMFSPPFSSAQEFPSLAIYIPLYHDDQLDGYLNPVLRLDLLVSGLLPPGFSDNYMLRVVDEGSQSIFFDTIGNRQGSRSAQHMTDAVVSPFNRPLRVHITRHRKAYSEAGFWLWIEIILMTAFSLVVGGLVYITIKHIELHHGSERRFQDITNLLPDMVCELDARYIITYLNQSASQMLGINPENTTSLCLLDFIDPLEQKTIFFQPEQHTHQEILYPGSVNMRRFDGISFVGEIVIRVIRDSGKHITGYRCVIRDMTNRIQVQRKLEYLAHYDNLTGIPNRSYFHERLRQAILRAEHSGNKVALLFCDLDRFKQINDSMGHHVGDMLLRVIAQRMKNAVRKTDSVSRLGGDEFVAIVEELGDDNLTMVKKIAEKILFELTLPVEWEGMTIYPAGSIGISIFPDHGTTEDALMRHADYCMYQSKSGQFGKITLASVRQAG